MRPFYYVFIVMLSFCDSYSQSNRYMVFLKDKERSPFSLSEPSKYLSTKSIERRRRLNIEITTDDLPVNPSYVSLIKQTGVKTFFTSKWWNAVLIQAEQTSIVAIESLPCVTRVELVAPEAKLISRVSQIQNERQYISEENSDQLIQLGIDVMHQEGRQGEGIYVAQFDSGWKGVNTISPFQHLYNDNRIKDVFNFVTNTPNIYADYQHGTNVLSIMAGYIPNTYQGGIVKATFFLYETDDTATEYRIEEYNWVFAAERADSIGVDIITSSLGYSEFDDASMNYKKNDLNGQTSVISKAAKRVIDKGILVVSSAGNEGGSAWKNITMPADVAGVLSVGSITAKETISPFSSSGPTSDGRIKPEVVALGSGTACIDATGAVVYLSGTSLAAPLVTCLAAGLIQEFSQAKPHRIVEAIVASGNNYTSANNQIGYGIPNYRVAKNYLTKKLTAGISVFQNTITNALLNIESSELSYPTTMKLIFYSLTGVCVASFSLTSDNFKTDLHLQLSELPNGMYILEVISEGEIKKMKILKAG